MLMMNEEDWIQETDGYLPILNWIQFCKWCKNSDRVDSTATDKKHLRWDDESRRRIGNYTKRCSNVNAGQTKRQDTNNS
jgi:hypothetical protein